MSKAFGYAIVWSELSNLGVPWGIDHLPNNSWELLPWDDQDRRRA
ncbi:MAG: hypothetical protein OXI11_11490 [Gammaproteobacteria bacterium]|nr:hypothetical protein [Gammaproteobacteria bacterium]